MKFKLFDYQKTIKKTKTKKKIISGFHSNKMLISHLTIIILIVKLVNFLSFNLLLLLFHTRQFDYIWNKPSF